MCAMTIVARIVEFDVADDSIAKNVVAQSEMARRVDSADRKVCGRADVSPRQTPVQKMCLAPSPQHLFLRTYFGHSGEASLTVASSYLKIRMAPISEASTPAAWRVTVSIAAGVTTATTSSTPSTDLAPTGGASLGHVPLLGQVRSARRLFRSVSHHSGSKTLALSAEHSVTFDTGPEVVKAKLVGGNAVDEALYTGLPPL